MAMSGPDTAISIARPLSLSGQSAIAPLDRRNLRHAWWRKSSGRSGRPRLAAQAGTYAEEYPSLARALGETDREAVNDDAFETSLRLILTELGAELSEASGLGSLRARNQREPAGSVVL